MSQRLECGQVLEDLESYLDSEISDGAAAIQEHLATCSDCRIELELASRIRSELRSWPELDTPPHVLREIFQAVGSERFGAGEAPPRPSARKPEPSHLNTRRPAWAALAAAVFAAVALGTSLYWTSRDTPSVAPESALAELPTVATTEIDPARIGPARIDPARIDPAEIARATEEARLALAYFAQVSRRTGLKVRDEVLIERLVKPSTDTLTRAFRPLGHLTVTEKDAGHRS